MQSKDRNKDWRAEQKKLGRAAHLIWVTAKEWDLDVKPLLERIKKRRERNKNV